MPFSKSSENNGIAFYLPCSSPELRFSRENTLLVTCSKTWVTPEEIKDVLDPDLDWGYIMEMAVWNRVNPLLFYNLERVDDSLVPSEAIESLHALYLNTVGHNLRASSETCEVLRFFLDRQIEAIVLKGMALCETVYRNTVPRLSSDIDLLIHRKDRHKLGPVLSQLGYELSPIHDEGFAERSGFAINYIKEDALGIDLHWHLFPLPYSKHISVDSFWKNAVSTNIGDISALVLSPEDLLIHLCLHVSKENYARLLWLVDISEVVYHYGEAIDWELLLGKIERYRMHLLMRYILNFVNELFHPPIPVSVFERLTSYRSLSFEAKLFGALGNPRITEIERRGIARFLKFYVAESKAKHVFRELFPGRDSMLKRYVGKSIYKSYCSRIWYILVEVIRSVRTSLQAITWHIKRR